MIFNNYHVIFNPLCQFMKFPDSPILTALNISLRLFKQYPIYSEKFLLNGANQQQNFSSRTFMPSTYKLVLTKTKKKRELLK